MKLTITVPYTLEGVQSAIHQLLDREGISEYELAKRAGLSPTSIYLILRKDPDQPARPVRRSTLQAIGNGVGYEVTIDSVGQRLTFRDRGESLATTTVVQEILDDIRGVLMRTDIKRLSKAERDRLKEVVRVMVRKCPLPHRALPNTYRSNKKKETRPRIAGFHSEGDEHQAAASVFPGSFPNLSTASRICD